MNAVDLSLVEACSPSSRLPAAEIKLVSDWLDASRQTQLGPSFSTKHRGKVD